MCDKCTSQNEQHNKCSTNFTLKNMKHKLCSTKSLEQKGQPKCVRPNMQHKQASLNKQNKVQHKPGAKHMQPKIGSKSITLFGSAQYNGVKVNKCFTLLDISSV